MHFRKKTFDLKKVEPFPSQERYYLLEREIKKGSSVEVDWKKIFVAYNEGEARKKKFQILPKVFPWAGDFQENVELTLEWLIREGKSDEVRLSKEPVTNVVKDGWYTLEAEPGHFIHVCYPREMLKFRGQYESLRQQIMGECSDEHLLKTVLETAEAARTKLWSAWGCIGHDGERVEPDWDKLNTTDHFELASFQNWPQKWTYNCSKCCSDLPKSLQAWQKLQHTKLKDLS